VGTRDGGVVIFKFYFVTELSFLAADFSRDRLTLCRLRK
jgi:hypothetical protein